MLKRKQKNSEQADMKMLLTQYPWTATTLPENIMQFTCLVDVGYGDE